MKYILLSLAFLFLVGCPNADPDPPITFVSPEGKEEEEISILPNLNPEPINYKEIETIDIEGVYKISEHKSETFDWESTSYCYNPLLFYIQYFDQYPLENHFLTIYVYNKDKSKKLQELNGASDRKIIEREGGFSKINHIHVTFSIPFDLNTMGKGFVVEVKNKKGDLLYTKSYEESDWEHNDYSKALQCHILYRYVR